MLELTRFAIAVILLQLHMSVSMKDAVSPDDPVVFIGDNLTLICDLNDTDQNVHGLSSLMYFTQRRHTPIAQQYVKVLSKTSIQLNYPIRSTHDETNYKCWLNQPSEDSKLLGHSFVTVEYRPVAVRNISCRVYNWDSMVCSWTLDNVFVQKRQFSTTLIWRIGLYNNGTQHHCPHQTKTSCTWYRHEDSDVFVPGSVYKVQVILFYNKTTSFSSKTAEAVSEEFVINSRMIVQPAPPARIQLNTTSTCVSLEWNDSTQHRQNKVFRLEFQSEWDGHSMWRECCNTEYSSMSKYSAQVCDLIPSTSYTFRVSSKPVPLGETKPRGFWSDWATIHTTTVGGLPGCAPEIAKGGYREENCLTNDDCREVTIYFKALVDQDKGGKFVEYRLQINGGDQNSSVVSNITVVRITISKKTDYEIRLYSRNKFGESSRFSTLSIPSSEKKPSVPETFLTEVDRLRSPSPATKYRLSWTPDSSRTLPAVGYTLYWCQLPLGGTECKNINWTNVDGNQSEFQRVFHIPAHSVTSNRYQFGISKEVWFKGKVISSGILWSDCIYTYYKHAKLPDPPEDFDLSSFQEGGSLAVTWSKPSCRGSSAYITHYVIQYCETEAYKICIDPDGTVNVIVSNNATRYVISDLKGDATYQVTIQAASRAGLGPTSVPVVGRVKWPGLRPVSIFAIAAGGIIAFGLILLGVWYIVKKCRRVKKKFRLQASYPVHQLDIPHHIAQMYTPIPIQDTEIKIDSGRGESDGTDESFPNICSDECNYLQSTHENTSPKDNHQQSIHENMSDGVIDGYSKFAEDDYLKPELSPCDENMNDLDEDCKARNMHPPLPQANSFVVGFVLSSASGSANQKQSNIVESSSPIHRTVDVNAGSVGVGEPHVTHPIHTHPVNEEYV